MITLSETPCIFNKQVTRRLIEKCSLWRVLFPKNLKELESTKFTRWTFLRDTLYKKEVCTLYLLVSIVVFNFLKVISFEMKTIQRLKMERSSSKLKENLRKKKKSTDNIVLSQNWKSDVLKTKKVGKKDNFQKESYFLKVSLKRNHIKTANLKDFSTKVP